MSMVSGVVGGVDTHADVHVPAALDQNGGLLGSSRSRSTRPAIAGPPSGLRNPIHELGSAGSHDTTIAPLGETHKSPFGYRQLRRSSTMSAVPRSKHHWQGGYHRAALTTRFSARCRTPTKALQ